MALANFKTGILTDSPYLRINALIPKEEKIPISNIFYRNVMEINVIDGSVRYADNYEYDTSSEEWRVFYKETINNIYLNNFLDIEKMKYHLYRMLDNGSLKDYNICYYSYDKCLKNAFTAELYYKDENSLNKIKQIIDSLKVMETPGSYFIYKRPYKIYD